MDALLQAGVRCLESGAAVIGVRSPPKVLIRYFKVQGAAEGVRHVLALSGTTWTETEYEVDFSKISQGFEVASPDYKADKLSGKLTANLDRAPVVEVDGRLVLGQKYAVERYLARRLGLFGADESEAVLIDMFSEHMRELRS
jgi:glutathione S-transferase